MAVKMRLQRHGSKKRPFYFIVVADARGSISVICLALVPAARRLALGIATSDSRECPVVRVSTSVLVGKSHVRSVWSCEAE